MNNLCTRRIVRVWLPRHSSCSSHAKGISYQRTYSCRQSRRDFSSDSRPETAPVNLRFGDYHLGTQLSIQPLQMSKLGKPHMWYPAARAMKRRVIMHVGPTNSGKTHRALQRLREANTGVYCGPLRLLAWEIFERMNDKGVPCTLVTGQELEERPGAAHISSTVEMVDIHTPVKVGVLDEIQMLSDESRGWAWTRVLLGLQVEELHCCGDAAAVPIVKELLGPTGDVITVFNYERLSPLQVASTTLRSFANISKGDCVVAFSRKELFEYKQDIERTTGMKCGVIYGALPPAVRREQARRFNDTSDADRTDVLVATDAIGMGLNLAIRRIIFSRLDKFDGNMRRELHISEMKQIGGRAGRFGSDFSHGEVTGFKGTNLKKLQHALASPTPALRLAGVLPTVEQLEAFCAALVPDFSAEDSAATAVSAQAAEVYGETAYHALVRYNNTVVKEEETLMELAANEACRRIAFSRIFDTFLRHVSIDSQHYFLCDYTDMLQIARLLDNISMSFRARYLFCMAPVDLDEPLCVNALRRYATKFQRGRKIRVGLHVPSEPPRSPMQLRELEAAHAVFDLYLWLSRRFPATFSELEAAQKGALATQALIQQGLEEMGETLRLRAMRRNLKAQNAGREVPQRQKRRPKKLDRLSEYWMSMQDRDDDASDEEDWDRDSKSAKSRRRGRRFHAH